MKTHLESWSNAKGKPACGADSRDQTQHAESVTCHPCRHWLVKQWSHWAYENWLEKATTAETHYSAWGDWSDQRRGICRQKAEDRLDVTGTVEFVSCALCQHILMSGWAGREAPRFRCAYCAGETMSWTGAPTECGHCKRPFLDVQDDPEFVASVHGVVDTIRDHVLKYRERYGSNSGLVVDLDHACSWLMTTISEEWQDVDRIYTPAEQQLDTRIDGCTRRQEAASDEEHEGLADPALIGTVRRTHKTRVYKKTKLDKAFDRLVYPEVGDDIDYTKDVT